MADGKVKGCLFDTLFPKPLQVLPVADIPLGGCIAHLSQGENHQILFMAFEKDVSLPEHAHDAQWGVVLEGEIELVIGGVSHNFRKGDRYFIPAGIRHSGKIHAGYADITFFGEKARYSIRASP